MAFRPERRARQPAPCLPAPQVACQEARPVTRRGHPASPCRQVASAMHHPGRPAAPAAAAAAEAGRSGREPVPGARPRAVAIRSSAVQDRSRVQRRRAAPCQASPRPGPRAGSAGMRALRARRPAADRQAACRACRWAASRRACPVRPGCLPVVSSACLREAVRESCQAARRRAGPAAAHPLVVRTPLPAQAHPVPAARTAPLDPAGVGYLTALDITSIGASTPNQCRIASAPWRTRSSRPSMPRSGRSATAAIIGVGRPSRR